MSAARDPVDADVRVRALAVDGSFIVQAPAGSGKTALLTRRVLRLLAVVDHPEEVVAITFTRKAAAEMRNRILGALEAARGPRPGDRAQAEVYDLASAALKRDAALGWNITDCPGRLRISTIDAFCAALVRQMPTLSRLGAMPEALENAGALYEEAARALIAHVEAADDTGAAMTVLLRHLDNDRPKTEVLLARMIARRDQWMRHLGSGNAPPDRERIEKGLARVVDDALAAVRAAIPAGLAAEICWLACYAAEHIRERDETSAVRHCRDLTDLPAASSAQADVWRGLSVLFTTEKCDWRRTVNARQGFPAPGDANDRMEAARRREAKERFVALVALLQDVAGLAARLAAVRRLPPPQYSQAQWETIETLCRLLPRAVGELWVIFGRQQAGDFTQIAWGALQALGTAAEPSDLALALDYRIRHLLIDEFQDTSVSQFELVERLTAGWEPGDGRTLFVVGDPMQSIYRFRQAEVGLFLRAWQRGIGTVRLEPLSLVVNFRSQQEIVEWVNGAFARVFPQYDDVAAGAVGYRRSEAWHRSASASAVTVHPFFGREDAREADVVAALAAEALTGAPGETVAILVRARGHLAAIAARLRARGLRFRAVEIETLGHRSIVQDLLALTRALMHLGDRLSWLAVLRAPWCGLTLADLEAVAGTPGQTVWQRIQALDGIRDCSDDGRDRAGRLRAALAGCIALAGRQPLRRLVEGAWIALGGPACCAGRTDLADAYVYLDLLEESAAGGDVGDTGDLAARVESLFALADVEAGEQLQLMTIHKAKGLQFGTVIVPGLGRATRSTEQPLLVWSERPDPRSDEVDLLLAPIRASGADADPVFGYLMELEQEKNLREEARLLYVAATRAVKHLHLLGHVNVADGDKGPVMRMPDGRSLLSRLWPAVEEEFARAWPQRAGMPEAVAPDSGRPAVRLLRRLPRNWRLPDPPASIVWNARDALSVGMGTAQVEFAWAQETIRHVGTVVHGCLQRMGNEGPQTWDAPRVQALRPLIRARLAEAGVPPARIEAAAGRCETALLGVLDDDRGRWILDAAHPESRSEYALGYIVDGELRSVVLDRTFVDSSGIRWIIDYKTSMHEGSGSEEFLDRERERYRGQLEHYAQIMARIDGRPLRLGLYFPLMKGWREWSVV